MLHIYYHKFETLISFTKVWLFAVVSVYIQPISDFLFIPIFMLLQNIIGADLLSTFERYWHVITAIAVGFVAFASYIKTRRETKKAEMETKKIDLETKLKEKELINYDLDHKFEELRMDIMFAEEKLAKYRNAEEKLKKMTVEDFEKLVNLNTYNNGENKINESGPTQSRS